jgi:hypothetical protein
MVIMKEISRGDYRKNIVEMGIRKAMEKVMVGKK